MDIVEVAFYYTILLPIVCIKKSKSATYVDFGSKLCSDSIAKCVFTEIEEEITILKSIDPDVLIDGDIYDSLLCEAINSIITEMNRKIKKESFS